jgi:hypothetical protein
MRNFHKKIYSQSLRKAHRLFVWIDGSGEPFHYQALQSLIGPRWWVWFMLLSQRDLGPLNIIGARRRVERMNG